MLFDTHTNLMWYPDHFSDEFVEFAWAAKKAKMRMTKDVYFAGSESQQANAFAADTASWGTAAAVHAFGGAPSVPALAEAGVGGPGDGHRRPAREPRRIGSREFPLAFLISSASSSARRRPGATHGAPRPAPPRTTR